MYDWPCVVVHGVAHVRAVLQHGRDVVLLSGRGAALYGGVGWWRALMGCVSAEHPSAQFQHVLDCADAPGAAMAALRAGQTMLVLEPAVPAYPAVAAAARSLGSVVLPRRPQALDLAHPHAAALLTPWLAGDKFPPLR